MTRHVLTSLLLSFLLPTGCATFADLDPSAPGVDPHGGAQTAPHPGDTSLSGANGDADPHGGGPSPDADCDAAADDRSWPVGDDADVHGDAPPRAPLRCPELLLRSIVVCVDSLAEDEDLDETAFFLIDRLLACADPEPVAAVWDEWCALQPATPECDGGIEGMVSNVLPLCIADARDEVFADRCALPANWRDLRYAPRLVLLDEGIVDASGLGAGDGILAQQVVLATEASVHRPANADEALRMTDDGHLHAATYLDIGSLRRLHVLTATFGDSRYGRIFFEGTPFSVATIVDGDIGECAVEVLPAGSPCDRDLDCGDGLECVGAVGGAGVAVVAQGRCLGWPGAEPVRGAGCRVDADCPAGHGLVCVVAGGVSECAPGWMRRRFELTPAALTGAATEIPIVVSGVATVSLETRLSLAIRHPRVADLRVWLAHPGAPASASEGPVAVDGVRASGELIAHNVLVRLPADEAINGVWTLRVVDTGVAMPAEERGALVGGELTVSSWFD